MIRAVSALFVFAVALCGYIVFGGDRSMNADNSDNPAVVIAEAAVSRAQSPSSLIAAAAVTMPQPAPNLIAAPVRNAAVPTTIQTDKTPMSTTTSNVLAGLGLNVAAMPAGAQADPMLEMTSSILSGIGAVTGQTVSASQVTPEAKSSLELLVVRALQEGQTDTTIDAMVNEAALSGDVVVPQVLVTSDGRVDTHVLLSAIVTQAQIASGQPAPAVPDVPTGEGTGVEVRVVQRADQTEQFRFYTVNSGDSLGAIAVKFYGSVDKFGMIFEANRSILSSPDRIRVGQRLAIPTI